MTQVIQKYIYTVKIQTVPRLSQIPPTTPQRGGAGGLTPLPSRLLRPNTPSQELDSRVLCTVLFSTKGIMLPSSVGTLIFPS